MEDQYSVIMFKQVITTILPFIKMTKVICKIIQYHSLKLPNVNHKEFLLSIGGIIAIKDGTLYLQ